MPATVFTSTIANALKNTLEDIIDDKLDRMEARLIFPKWMNVGPMNDNYEDDLEAGGPGLASEKTEGAAISTGTIKEGALTRYLSRTFGIKLIISREAMEDAKYPKILRGARRCKESIYLTADVDATNILVRAENSNYVGGDGQSLASASHTLPHGGTFSNTLATPQSASHAAVITMTSAIRKLPGHHGVTIGYEPKKVVCPTEQWAVWDALVGSRMTPGVENELNVVNRLGLEVVPIKYWTNTTTNWAMITDVENGLKFKWRRKPEGNSWVENDQTVMKLSCTARWSNGWSDPRGLYFSGI